jgi:type 1 fimbriae regulatory protein FimB
MAPSLSTEDAFHGKLSALWLVLPTCCDEGSTSNVRRKVKSAGAVWPIDAHERTRDYLTEDEFLALLEGTKGSRHRCRNAAMLMLTFYHGLRASEVCHLKWQDVDLTHGRIWIHRLKGSLSTEQPLLAQELRTLKRYLKQRGDSQQPWLFLRERGEQFTRYSINYLVRAASERAGLAFAVYPHMLRHSCGYALANRGYDVRLIQDYLGHRDPKHTMRYTRTAASRFENLWS